MEDDAIKEIRRKLESIQKTLDRQDADRGILEDILLKFDQVRGEMRNMQEEMKLLRTRVDKMEKTNRGEFEEVKGHVEEIKEQITG